MSVMETVREPAERGRIRRIKEGDRGWGALAKSEQKDTNSKNKEITEHPAADHLPPSNSKPSDQICPRDWAAQAALLLCIQKVQTGLWVRLTHPSII